MCGMGLKRSNGSIDPKKKLMLERIRSFFQSNEAIITINEKIFAALNVAGEMSEGNQDYQ